MNQSVSLIATEAVFQRIFEVIRDGFRLSQDSKKDYSWGYIQTSVRAHLRRGTLDFRNPSTPNPFPFPLPHSYPNGSVFVKELDIYWDQITITVGFDIPQECVGGQCIVPNPFGGCAVRLPEFCAFDANPDVVVVLDIPSFISEISLIVGPRIQFAPSPFRWQLFFDDPVTDFDLIDIPDIAGDFVHRAEEAILAALGDIPQWGKDAILAILGGIEDLLRRILDIPDDIQEWLQAALNESIGPINLYLNTKIDEYLDSHPIAEIADPYALSDAPLRLHLPIRDLGVVIYDRELVMGFSIG